jgi:formylglycine-generating enzyme required for sulfatase activity
MNIEYQHQVTITKPFYMQTTDVTQSQWTVVMGTDPWKGKWNFKEGPNYAATYVSWDDAVAYCKKLDEGGRDVIFLARQPGGGVERDAATDTENRDEIRGQTGDKRGTNGGQTGDKRGTQPPATPRTALQRKSQFVINARENMCFSDIVGILENTLVAEEGLLHLVF